MSIWLKDTETYDGAMGATRNGMFAALGFGALIVLGIVVLLTGNGAMIGAGDLDPVERMVGIGFVVAELAIVLLAAYRFRIGKGLVTGSATLLIFVIEIGMKIFAAPFAGVLWYIAYLAILVGLINGIRGAIALRQRGDPVEVGETFQ